MSQVSFLFHNIFLLLCTLVTLWLANVPNHNVIQVLSPNNPQKNGIPDVIHASPDKYIILGKFADQ